MKQNRVKALLRDGQFVVGCWSLLGSPSVAELMAHAGFDWVLMDMEHTAIDLETVQSCFWAIGDTETAPFVRVPSNSDPMLIKRLLDIGAGGIAVPHVNNRAEAEAAVRATKYPPRGIRGFGPVRATHYIPDRQQDYADRADDEILVLAVMESGEAAENVEEIAATPGLDGLFVGPCDLSMSMGFGPGLGGLHPHVEAAIERMLKACRDAGIAAGNLARTAEEAREWIARGGRIVGFNDFYLLASAARNVLDRIRG